MDYYLLVTRLNLLGFFDTDSLSLRVLIFHYDSLSYFGLLMTDDSLSFVGLLMDDGTLTSFGLLATHDSLSLFGLLRISDIKTPPANTLQRLPSPVCDWQSSFARAVN